MKNITVLTLTLLVCSCCGSKPVVTGTKETVTLVETLRDTVVMIETDASMVSALLECDENRNIVIRELLELQSGIHIKPPQMVIRDNIITVTAAVDSFEIYITWKEREKRVESVQTITVVKNELTGWQWFQVWLGRLGIVAAVAAVFYRVLIIPAGVKTIKKTVKNDREGIF